MKHYICIVFENYLVLEILQILSDSFMYLLLHFEGSKSEDSI